MLKETPGNFLLTFLLTWCHFFLLFPSFSWPPGVLRPSTQCFLDFVTMRRTSPPACYHSLSTQGLSNLKILSISVQSMLHPAFRATPATSPRTTSSMFAANVR